MKFNKILIAGLLFTYCLVSQAQNIGSPFSFSETLEPGETYMNIQLLGALELRSDKLDDLHARELSGLAWDEDEQLLYALSDDGHIVHLSPVFSDNHLSGVNFINAYPLRDKDKNILEGDASDAESLAIINQNNSKKEDTNLIISLESPQRIHKFKTDGTFIAELLLPDQLINIVNNNNEKPTIDALSYHADYDYIMAPVRPFTEKNNDLYSIYSSKGDEWYYPPLDKENSATLGMETLDDGNLLIIERVYSSMFKPVIYALRKLLLKQSNSYTIKVEEIAHFNSREGWLIDNFEGIASHKNGTYFMISDDNESRLQKTLLIYFKLLD